MTELNKNYTKMLGTDDPGTIDDTNSTQIDEIEADMTTIETDLTANQAATALNTTHRGSDGKDHSDVVLNNTHRASDGKDHSDVVLNNTHRGSDGKDHSDVVLANTHRGLTNNPHSVTATQVGKDTAQWNASIIQDITVADLTGIADTNVLKYNSISGKFEFGPASVVADLNDLDDVNAPTPTDGYALVWDQAAGEWQDKEIIATSLASINDITNVNVPSPNDEEVLTYDSTSATWVSSPNAGANVFVFDETPSETPNGSITNFSTAYQFSSGKIEVFKNGVKMTETDDYTEDADKNGITFVTAPATGSVIRFFYLRASLMSIGDSGAVGAETPSGLINGSNTTYDTANTYIAGTLKVYLNGQRLTLTEDYTETDSDTFEMVTAPETGDILRIDYDRFLPSAGNATTLDGYASSALTTGWIPVSDSWSYSSADAPSYVITVPSGAASIYSVGMRIKLTQPTDGVKYFIITKVADTALTVYGGTDYDLDNEAISSIYYSTQKAPLGFPLDPVKWTEEYNNTSLQTTAGPATSTWYNKGSLDIPIGCWNVHYQACFQIGVDVAANMFGQVTLSTANNSSSDADFDSSVAATAALTAIREMIYRSKTLTLSSKATYYLNYRATASADDLYFLNSASPAIIRAVCAYL